MGNVLQSQCKPVLITNLRVVVSPVLKQAMGLLAPLEDYSPKQNSHTRFIGGLGSAFFFISHC